MTFSFLKKDLFLSVRVFCLCVYMHSMWVPGAYRGQKRAFDPLKLELQMTVVNFHVGQHMGNKTQILWRAASIPNCWAISLAMNLNFWYPCLKFLIANIPCGEQRKARGREVQSNCVLLMWANLCQRPHRLRPMRNGTAFLLVWVWILMVWPPQLSPSGLMFMAWRQPPCRGCPYWD